jgi:hypothetical protein
LFSSSSAKKNSKNPNGHTLEQSHGMGTKEAYMAKVQKWSEDDALYKSGSDLWFLAHEHLRALKQNKELQQEHARLQQELAQLQQEQANRALVKDCAEEWDIV